VPSPVPTNAANEEERTPTIVVELLGTGAPVPVAMARRGTGMKRVSSGIFVAEDVEVEVEMDMDVEKN
jgi:hypothetical protein